MTRASTSTSPLGRVLLVDDSEDLREAMATLLCGRYQIFQAADGISALALIEQQEIDVIVLDENMPNMGGHDCFVALRKKSIYIPVIFCTGDPLEDFKKRELTLGAFDYIQKPLNAESFIHLVDEAYGAMQRIREILQRKTAV